MKKSLVFSFITILLFVNKSNSQDYPIADRHPKIEKIERARALLIDAIIEHDKVQAREITTYLTELEDENYLTIFKQEYWLISYWVGDFDKILNDFARLKTSNGTVMSRVIPRQDMLYAKILEYMRDMHEEVISSIKAYQIPSTERDFLELNFKYMIARDDFPVISQKDLNLLSDDFLEKYPNTMFEEYIRQNIRHVYKPKDWGFGVEFFSGYGIFTDELSDKFKNNVPMGVAFDVSYKKCIFYLRDYIGFSRTLHDIPFSSGTWLDHSQVRVFLPEASVGLDLLDTKFFKLVPFAGISATDISPTEYDRGRIAEYDDVGLDFTSTYTYGINLDFKLGSGNGMIMGGPEDSYWFVRVRYAYNQPQFNKKYQGYDGNFHYITIGVGGFGRKLVRDF